MILSRHEADKIILSKAGLMHKVDAFDKRHKFKKCRIFRMGEGGMDIHQILEWAGD
jgi:hypothetical protein